MAMTLLRADGVLLPALGLAGKACSRQQSQHLDESIIRASDDKAAAAAESNAVHGEAVAAQGALVAQLLHILARLQQTPGAMYGWGPPCLHKEALTKQAKAAMDLFTLYPMYI